MRKCLLPFSRLARQQCCIKSSLRQCVGGLTHHDECHLSNLATLRAQVFNTTGSRASHVGFRHYKPHRSTVQRLLRILPKDNHVDQAQNKDNIRKIRQLLLEEGSNDVLYDLAVKEGRWKAAVWIVRHLMETTPSNLLQRDDLSTLVQQNASPVSLKNLTNKAIQYDAQSSSYSRTHGNIDSMVAPYKGRSDDERSRDSHRLLGCVWRALGRMVIACVRDPGIAKGFVKPEILEILALFHHYGFMPASVYSYAPSDQLDAAQQPALLYLLSKNIMVALSDAAWRARQAAALESGSLESTRLEMLSTSVRVNIEAVKPEVWLELILWSCLHGGWLMPGTDVLNAVCQEKTKLWKPLSWRKVMRDTCGIELTEQVDWEEVSKQFEGSRRSPDAPPELQFERTLSSELVSAFVEALADGAQRGVGVNGGQHARVLAHLEMFNSFLRRSRLCLHGGTWDAIILRLIENDPSFIADTNKMEDIVKLSPRLAQELNSRTEQIKHEYVLDANAALLGLLHRALRTQIDLGSITGALKIFKLIRESVDTTRNRSIWDFFEKSRLLHVDTDLDVERSEAKRSRTWHMFTSNFDGIEHPEFDLQIPLDTMGALLDLATASGDHDFGRSLIYDPDVDTPLIPELQYSRSELATPLVRFAVATDDKELLAKVENAWELPTGISQLNVQSSQAIMDALLSELAVTRTWKTATQMLRYMHSERNPRFSPQIFTHLLCTILVMHSHGGHHGQTESGNQAALADLIQSRFVSAERSDEPMSECRAVLDVLSSVDDQIELATKTILDKYTISTCPNTANFNTILEAVATTRGSAAAKTFLEAFLPATTPTSNSNVSSRGLDAEIPWIDNVDQRRPRTIKASNGRAITVDCEVTPNLTSFATILKHGLIEMKQQKEHDQEKDVNQDMRRSTNDLIDWTVAGMLGVGMHGHKQTRKDVITEVQHLVSSFGADINVESLATPFARLYKHAVV